MPKLVAAIPPPLGVRGATAGAGLRAVRLCVKLGLQTVDGNAARSSAPLGGAQVRLLRLLRARPAAPGGSTLPGGRLGALGALPLSRMPERAASKGADSTPFGHPGKVEFREVLDALIKANYKNPANYKNGRKVDVEQTLDDADAAPPAVRAVLEQKRQRRSSKELETAGARKGGGDADRSEAMAMRLARGLFCRLVQRKREYWAVHPEQHPSYRRNAGSPAGHSP